MMRQGNGNLFNRLCNKFYLLRNIRLFPILVAPQGIPFNIHLYIDNFVRYYTYNEIYLTANQNEILHQKAIIFNGPDYYYYDRLLLNPLQNVDFEQLVEETCAANDIPNIQGIVKNYTGLFSRIINNYNYVNFIKPFFIRTPVVIATFFQNLQIPIPTQQEIDDLNNAFRNIRNEQQCATGLTPMLQDGIRCYRFQDLKVFNGASYTYGDSIEVGDIIHNYTYLSCTTKKSYINFYRENSVLFRILLNKNDDYIFINDYSYTQAEKEILINKDVRLKCIEKNIEAHFINVRAMKKIYNSEIKITEMHIKPMDFFNFFELQSQKEKIQEAMEERALQKILQKIIPEKNVKKG
jgi:hypothetical protein